MQPFTPRDQLLAYTPAVRITQVQTSMSHTFRRFRQLPSFECAIWIAAATLTALPAFGQDKTCLAVAQHPASAADTAYSEGSYRKAEDLYGEALVKHPRDLQLSAALVHTWMHEGEISQASA
jgi:hypothetical protein